jgi:sterol desaturase/sphingolipid hydroxylase (fatty acid hydroxylase superfamily)
MDRAFYLLFGISAPFYVILIGIEMLLSHFHGRHLHSTKGILTNIWMNAANFLLDFCMRGVFFFVITYFLRFRFMELHNPVVYWVSLLLLEDLLFYFLHRVDHFCRFFWAVHVTHHSSEEFNLTVGFRSSVFQPLYRFIWFIPLAFLGFRPWDILFIYSITQIYGIIIHTQLVGKLGFLEWFLATPSHHRVHHGSNIPYLDKNLGMVLIIWDRMFGTFEEETEEVRYGLTENIHSYAPAKILFHEWKSMAHDLRKPVSLKSKMLYLFGPPGWSHDGSKKTSRQLRQEANRNKTNP